jgi:hypothetical protein
MDGPSGKKVDSAPTQHCNNDDLSYFPNMTIFGLNTVQIFNI